MKRGLFIGRFQPFHLGHLHIIKFALKEVKELIIGIGSSQKENTNDNPFTVKERIEMIDSALPANEISNYTLYPIPDYPSDNKWTEEVETLIPNFDIVYMSDKNTFGEKWIERCFKENYMIKKIKALKGIDSTTIREKMLNDEIWQDLVPEEIKDYIEKIKGVKRLKNLE